MVDLIWSITLSTLLSTNGEGACVSVFAKRADMSDISCNVVQKQTLGEVGT